MSNHNPHPASKTLLSLDEALALLQAAATPLAGVESVPVSAADGRILAADLVAGLDVPAMDNSAMDGYAVRRADFAGIEPCTVPVSQRIVAGDSRLQPLALGTAARIFTGALVPPGADAVLMQEWVETVEADAPATEYSYPEGIRLNASAGPIQPGQSIRRLGEDMAAGSTVLTRGTRLNPAMLGLAASLGLDKLPVALRPRVALLSTGNELVQPGAIAPGDMKPGAVYNSNRVFLAALLTRLGCTVTDLGLVPDQLDATVQALEAASGQHDLVISSGGVSVGEEDHVKPAVQRLGSLQMWQIAIKPGKPFAYGRMGDAHFVGLPGNPVSSLVTFLLLVRPLVLWLQGASDVALKPMAARAGFEWAKADKRREFLRVRLEAESGLLALFPNQGSGVLTSAAWADGLVDVAPGRAIAKGEAVPFLPFSAFWG